MHLSFRSLSSSSLRRVLAWAAVAVAAALLPTPARAETALVIRGARIITGDGRTIAKGTVTVVGDKIVSVADDATPTEVPANATIIDGAGLTVYPGLIDAYCLAGVPAAPSAPAPAAAAPQGGGQRRGGGGGNRAATPTPPAPTPLVWRKATEGWNAKSSALPALRNNGYTAALFGARGVLTPGEDILLALAPGETPVVLQDRAGVNVNTLSRGNGYPSTLMGAFAYLRQSFYDAVYQRDSKPVKPEQRLEGLAAAVDGRIPVFYAAGAENDIKRALQLGAEFKLKTLILGGKDAEKVAARIGAEKAAVVLTDDWGPAIGLAKAGVPFALASGKIEMDASEADELHTKALALAGKGMSPEAILAALTSTPARLLGASDRLGTVTAGKLAHLTVVEGDLFSKDGKVKFVVVNGQKVEPAKVAYDAVKPARVASDGVPHITRGYDDADGDSDNDNNGGGK